MIRHGIVLSFFLLVWLSCQKEVDRFEPFEDYYFSGIDAAGGTWKPILLGAPDSILISMPYDQSSGSYRADLELLQRRVSSISEAQSKSIAYWTNNPVLRWNEIALELAAKYNLIPPPNPDGSYTLPNPANPQGPPKFPFSHPPYTSRMLAHLSVAQFDGLITAWHYKYLHKRKHHHTVYPAIELSYRDNQIPPFPCEGSVVAEVSKAVLKSMFPLEANYLDSLYNDHLNSLAHSGFYISQDISAGVQIGEQITSRVLQRASTDGMSKAQTSKAVSDSIRDAAFQKFGWNWANMENPVRPVGLVPLYGNVKMWNVDDVATVRSAPPPALGSPEFLQNVEELERIAKNLTSEQRRIANWWEDGLGSYTPPGHWNKLAKRLCIKNRLNPLRSARVFAYMNMAVQDAGIACWETKYYYHYPRPIQTISGFKTILGTPNFPAYTSGHSTFSAAAAEVLSYVFPSEAAYCKSWAEEAALSRIYGGIHYRFDADAGLEQGKKVASYAIAKARLDGAD